MLAWPPGACGDASVGCCWGATPPLAGSCVGSTSPPDLLDENIPPKLVLFSEADGSDVGSILHTLCVFLPLPSPPAASPPPSQPVFDQCEIGSFRI